jgi:type IV secretory pathway TrbF-like protein
MLMTQSIPPAGKADKPRKATPWQVAKAVFWSFLGIRRRAAHEHDAVTLTPLQVIIAGIIGAVIFVLSLVVLVSIITS